MRTLDTAVQEEIEKGSFEGKIKKECAWCGFDIPGTLEWYCSYGNACQTCSALFSKIMGGIRGTRRTK